MFDTISFSELITILLIALVVFGPHRLPELARRAGKWVAEIRKTAVEFKRSLDREVQELNAPLREVKDELKGVAAEIERTGQQVRNPVQWIGPEPGSEATNAPADRRPEDPE